MITEDYVSFETAKLLKEKGFDWGCSCINYPPSGTSLLGHTINNTGLQLTREAELCIDKKNLLTIPTIQMAMKWLREKHNQNVTVKAFNNVMRLKTTYYAEVQNLLEPGEKGFCVNGCIFKDTYEEAVEYAINYCLKNLI